jgi:hypothetical protein
MANRKRSLVSGRPRQDDSRLRQFARQTGTSKRVKSAVRRLGFDLVRRHYYSPVPDLAELPDDFWSRESELRGVDFDIANGLEFVQQELAPYIEEYTPPRTPTGNAAEFYLENGWYESVDAETLYAMVRRSAPRRVIELGSGMSTLVIADARARGDVHGSEHLVYDPYARPELADSLATRATLQSVSASEIPLTVFESLRAGDILFVDTTHTVKLGGDVNRIVLDVLPSLSPGVYVHFHDIFLPWDYPQEFLVERSFFWAEQYLLQAFLAFNRQFEILFGAHAIQRRFSEDLGRVVPSAHPEVRPSAFWLRRVEEQAAR